MRTQPPFWKGLRAIGLVLCGSLFLLFTGACEAGRAAETAVRPDFVATSIITGEDRSPRVVLEANRAHDTARTARL